MASIYQLKSAFQNVLRPLTRALAAAHVTANQVTLTALTLSCLVGGVIAANPDRTSLLLLLPGTLFVRMALNAIDGMLAREHDMKTRLGAVLNELGDVVSDSALYLPLALVPAFNHWLVVGLVILAVMVEMVGVVAIQIGASRN
jgi:CDP-diacylglycerol--glycerol-3-phosphate 3-phosphatidyltransferase